MYISHSPFNDWNASLFACLHGCAVACAYYATKQTSAHRRSAAQLYFICFVNSCFRWVAVGRWVIVDRNGSRYEVQFIVSP